ncbi:MAG: nucleoside deaminase [Prochloraceae cyanobacterium]
MLLALEMAEAAGESGEVPVGAVIVDTAGKLIAKASNRKERDRNPTAHAEIIAIRSATAAIGTKYLETCTLYVTLEPCPMCAGAIVQARIGLLVYGADDPKSGAIRTVGNIPDSSMSNHKLAVLGGIMESATKEQLKSWFSKRRTKN